MSNGEPNAVQSSSNGQINPTPHSAVQAAVPDNWSLEAVSCTESTHDESVHSVSRLQFFVRMISEGKTLVIRANSNDTVKSLHEKIHLIAGVPVIEQRLIYRAKQLHWEQSLSDCSIQNDAGLQLVGRMRSTEHPQAWQVIDGMVSSIRRRLRGESPSLKSVKSQLAKFLQMTPRNDVESAATHLQIFTSSSAPAALVMLYMSPIEGNKEIADNSIRYFLNSSGSSLPKPIYTHCAPIVFEFCKLFNRFFHEDPLYLFCRITLQSLIETIGVVGGLKFSESPKALISLQETYPFVTELAIRLSKDLVLSMELPMREGPLQCDVRDFMAFLLPLRTVILEQVGLLGPISMPIQKGGHNYLPLREEEIEFLYGIYNCLMRKMDCCLKKMEGFLALEGTGEDESHETICWGWSQYLVILKELNGISKLYLGVEEQFWAILRCRKVSVCALIIRYAKQSEDNRWLLEHKDVTDFESRRHLVVMMFPKVNEEFEEPHMMLIDRSQLLVESFEHIARADPGALHGGLIVKFKNEEATGPGVLREWLVLICQEIFNPKNALFIACPNDRRRFYPNPGSRAYSLHLQYFSFSGRVIALALMHKVQVGIVFDRLFFLQLAGMFVSLEDILDADPGLYNTCKQVLEVDAELMDSDALGLTFVTEVEDLSGKVVELCPGGKSIIVNSKNREEYVHLLIQHHFVTSISEQVSHFAQGFADILSNPSLQKLFFQSLELEDLDWMLHGSESAICDEDWKARWLQFILCCSNKKEHKSTRDG